jgi:hypothetical protein
MHGSMSPQEWRKGRQALVRLANGLEALANDPEALARMDRAALEDPTLLEGPTLLEYLGLEDSENPDSDSEPFPLF